MCDWKEGKSRSELFDDLLDIFYHELDSWYNSSIFYCESCVDKFIEQWPGIYNRDMYFQRNALSLSTFYEGSRVRDVFTKEEFTDIVKDLTCPNCDDQVSGFIFPYEMNFDIPENFEDTLKEIAAVAEDTPFLLYEQPFVKKVCKEIETISKTIKTSDVVNPLFRATQFEEIAHYKNDRFLPKREYINEGRYNHAGQPVLYVGEDDLTCYFETREPEEGIMLARVEIQTEMKILDLMDENLDNNDIIQAIKFSSLMSSPKEGEGPYKPHYIFTRLVADVAKSVGFDAIRYPSIRFNKGFNIAVLTYEKIKEHIKIVDFKYVPKDVLISKLEKQRFFY
ncbi:RES family NAD+ phosphorylase [Peribacillus frigoritolerans]|uniref:RES family NAD+ phosphorylase n=1 Tax=Peribacillus frigoritolerans TaxID=450367 RepID=UPI0035187284